MKQIEFKGLKHYPSGNSLLKINNNILEVREMNGIHDGITIDTSLVKSWSINLSPIPVARNAVFGVTFNNVSNGKMSRTLFQWLIMQSPDGRYAYIVVNNTDRQGSIINVSGRCGESEVFKYTFSLSKASRDWITVVVFRLIDKPLVLTDTGYELKTFDKKIALEKSITVSGFVCLNNNEHQLVEVDRINITCCSKAILNLDIETAKINQVILNGQDVQLAIINESYIL